ncbi:MAG: hypothetical protein D6711_08620 [Chloroflexi bacterium]|nr:MAG: hypothetical protein D6711_08620 [Chloroflexota bacterium]
MRYLLVLFLLAACTLSSEFDEKASVTQPTSDSQNHSASLSINGYTPFSPEIIATLEVIYARGLALGNNPHRFSKVGDSITVSPNFLTPLDYGMYDLGTASYLQVVIDHFSGSFAVDSLAADIGWAAWGVLDQRFSPPGCPAPPLICEYQTRRPILAVILFGTNDSGYRTLAQYQADLEQIVATSIDMGVIPLLTTIPNRPEMPNHIIAMNDVVYDVAEANNLPVIDFYAATLSLPRQGLSTDNLHPSAPAGGWENAARFIPPYTESGYVIRNWITLEMLYWVWDALLRTSAN